MEQSDLNVLRCLYLEGGLSRSRLHRTGWEHSMKNELIIAKYRAEEARGGMATARLAAGVWPVDCDTV
jgi:hypothetical protein